MFFRKCCCGKKNRKMLRSVPILVLGLDSAGKSSIIKRILGESVISVVPTVGFNRVKVNYSSKYQVFLYDLGGGENFRTIWKQYLGTAYGVIYVIDSNDFQRIEENRQVFEQLLADDNMRYKPLLLLANKQDMEAALDEVDIVERLNVHSLVNSFRCPTTIELCSALEPPVRPGKCCAKSKHPPGTGDGVQTGFRWLMKQIDEYYDDLQLKIEEVAEREQKEYALKREKWKEEKRRREEDEKEEEEDEGESGNPFRPVDEILSAKSLSNGFKTSAPEEKRDETNVSNFQIKNSCENLQDYLSNNHEGSKKKQPKKRKKKVAPLSSDDMPDATELPPLRIPARNVNMAWTEETQINTEDNQSRESILEPVEDIKRETTLRSEAVDTERAR